MDNALMIGVNTQQLLRRSMDVVANNLANMNTTGFKAESVLSEERTERPARAVENPGNIRFAEEFALNRDMRTGTLKLTSNPLDLALETDNAFFSIQRGDEVLYARNGQFALDELSRLVARDGSRVLDVQGKEIVFDPEGDPATISTTGVIRQGNVEVGQIGIFQFELPQALEKAGENLWRSAEPGPALVEQPNLRQGYLEASNVTAILELTDMLQISKAYESASRIVKNADDMRERAIERLGRAS